MSTHDGGKMQTNNTLLLRQNLACTLTPAHDQRCNHFNCTLTLTLGWADTLQSEAASG